MLASIGLAGTSAHASILGGGDVTTTVGNQLIEAPTASTPQTIIYIPHFGDFTGACDLQTLGTYLAVFTKDTDQNVVVSGSVGLLAPGQSTNSLPLTGMLTTVNNGVTYTASINYFANVLGTQNDCYFQAQATVTAD